MPALEPLEGLRVVAEPAALDAARWHGGDVTVLRLAPDDALALGATGVDLDDAHAIIEAEVGFAGVRLPIQDVLPHVEWAMPAHRPTLVQGAVAGVPAKLWLPDEGEPLLMTAAPFADELGRRLR